MGVRSGLSGREETNMSNALAQEIMEFVKKQAQPVRYPPVSETVVRQAETSLGFKIPHLLTFCFTHVSNGGFGPGYGIMGLDGGCASDYGTLVETFESLKKDQEAEGKQWKAG